MQAYNIKNTRKKIYAGSFVVYLILSVSLGVSIAYWYILAGASNTEDQTIFWTFIIWLVVAVGFVAEVIKKATISLFRNLPIWSVATFVSILTVMGTYSILDQDKQSELVKQSDGYQMAKGQKGEALKEQSKYAYAKNYNIEELEKKKRIAGTKARWGTFNGLKKDIEAKKKYESAVNTLGSSSKSMNIGGAGKVSSNPFLANMAEALGIKPALLKSFFYLFVTLLLEIAAYWIGGQVEKLRQMLELTEAEILDLKIMSTFGVSMRDINANLFANVMQSQIEQQDAENEIKALRKTNRAKLPAGETADQIAEIKAENKYRQEEAKQPPRPASNISKNKKNTEVQTVPYSGSDFGFMGNQNIAPKQVQGTSNLVPKKVRESNDFVPKKVHQESVPIGSIEAIGTGTKRKKETPDTGTKGKNSNRYNALKKAVINGMIKPTHRGIKSFKYGGRGMGDSTASIYKKALYRDGVL